MLYLTLFFEFFKVGLFSIGGGLASLPFLYALADKYDWYTPALLTDIIAISESTPGPIGINMATYVGYTTAGIAGGILASLALMAPSFLIIMLVVKILDTFSENKYVKAVFYGLRPAVTALIAAAAISVMKITLIDIPAYAQTQNIVSILNYKQLALFFILLYATNKLNKHPIWFIAASAVIGIILGF